MGQIQPTAHYGPWAKSVFHIFLRVEIKPIEDEFVTHEIHM